MIKDFLEEHGNGFWLHGLGAVAVVLIFWYFLNLPTLGLLLSGGWFVREVKQHSLKTVWTFHRILEWGTPIIAALITWGLVI